MGWAVPHPGENLYINNYVLTEVVSLFFNLAVSIFNNAEERAKTVKVFFGFMNEKNEGTSYELSSAPISRQFGSFEGKKVPAENKVFSTDFSTSLMVPEVEALRMLKEIYHWFGFTDEEIPYVDAKSNPERVDRNCYVAS